MKKILNKLIIFIKKIINTFLTPKSINISNYLPIKKNKYFFDYLPKFFWFLPDNNQKRYWKFAHLDKIHNYEKYINMDNSASLLINEIRKYSNLNDRILDLCCNVGRFINQLQEYGFKKVHGVDINDIAISKINKIFPKVNKSKIECSSIERYLPKIEDKFFDVVFTYGATIELIAPSFPLIREISRVTKRYFILMINENGHAYPRFWRYEFKKNNFKIVEIKKVDNSHSTFFVLKKIK